MKDSMLEIQQYLKIHPILKKDAGLREKYVVLLKHFVDKTMKSDLWSKQVMKLYAKIILNEDIEPKDIKAKDLNVLQKFKFFQYRYFLLTDCLFIHCFDNKKKGEQILENVIKFYGERYRKKMSFVFEAFYSFEDNGLLQSVPELEAVYSIIWKNRKFLSSRTKRIMITANMSAGKSTLMNALMGKKINKTQNDTCTAKIHFLHNKAGEDGLNYEWEYDLELDASFDILMNDNVENDSHEIHVGTRFRSLCEIENKVCFIDTPGVNSSMDKTHRVMSNEAIKNIECDLLIYLFNAENIGSDDDIKHLKYVKDNYNGKVIFLVNRLDRFKKDSDSVPQTLESVKKDLSRIGFGNPEVYPVSAYAAYLSKMEIYGEQLSEDERDDLEFVKRKLKKGEFSYEKYYPDYAEVNIKLQDDLGEVLLHSGILSLEEMIYT